MRLDELSIIVPAYSQPLMLAKQLETWAQYDDETLSKLRFIVVDDASPEPLEPVVGEAEPRVFERTRLYRVIVDVPWGRGSARNLGTHVCESAWLVHVDLDHVLPAAAASALFDADVDLKHWYRFRRYRVGKADETRKKDFKKTGLRDDAEFGEVGAHIDSYLVTKEMYAASGGYHPAFNGCLGGGSPFLAELTKVGGEPKMLPDDVCLHVYTRHVIPDASVFTLDRDTTEYTRRKKALMNAGKLKGHDPLRFEWERIL